MLIQPKMHLKMHLIVQNAEVNAVLQEYDGHHIYGPYLRIVNQRWRRQNNDLLTSNKKKNMEIQIFENEQFGQLRGMNIEGEPWFVGKDVAQVLGYKDASKAVCNRVDKEDKTTLPIQQCGSNYKTQATFINESGLYALILSSKLPKAREFKRWVTAEVLPQIRRTRHPEQSRGISTHNIEFEN